MTEKCFKKCISKPGTTLDSSEQVHLLNVKIQKFVFQQSFRNVLLCVWIDTWIHGIWFQEHIV